MEKIQLDLTTIERLIEISDNSYSFVKAKFENNIELYNLAKKWDKKLMIEADNNPKITTSRIFIKDSLYKQELYDDFKNFTEVQVTPNN